MTGATSPLRPMASAWRPWFAVLAVSLSILAAGHHPRFPAFAARQAGQHEVFVPLVLEQSPVGQVGPIYGVNFMSSAEDPADAGQYANALSTGARWNRWPIYWFNVEQAPGDLNWSAVDANVIADLANGLQINAILLGTPTFYLTGDLPPATAAPEASFPRGPLSLLAPQAATPQGLYEPVFADGSDLPGPGKSFNLANKWAVFVGAAIDRYRPGGALAQANGWGPGMGVTHWEMWNEPDLSIFWDASVADYARLLKVGFLAARHTDPHLRVIFGGLANNFATSELLNYYNNVMAIYDSDPLAVTYAYFHDILATHSYYYAWQSWYHVFRAGNTLGARGLDKPIWLNETGVPAWNDYPGPVWDPSSALRATMNEQADYVIQTTFYAMFAGADAIFHFQLYDGCGNQPRFTDFPPHNGELCDGAGKLITDPTKPCAGDANGLFRNPTDAACFTHHPQPESARANYDAFRLLTGVVTDVEPLWRTRPGSEDPNNGPQEWIAFYQPASGDRVIGLWTRFGQDETARLPASASSARLYTPDGTMQIITPVGGEYDILLPGATNQNNEWGDPNLYPIGGRPRIVVEADTRAPEASAQATRQGNDILVSWSADDHLGSGVIAYDVHASVNGGPEVVWLEGTTLLEAIYAGNVANSYQFRVTARDRAGTVSAPVTVWLPGAGTVDIVLLPTFVFR